MTTRRALLLLATVAGAVLVACGGDDENLAGLSADEILDRTQKAIADAKSVHASGDTVDDDGTKMKLDFHISDTGTTGTITAEDLTFEVLVTDRDFFMKGDKETWTTLSGDAAAGELLGGRYVKVPTTGDEDFKDIEALADWDSFVKDAFEPDGQVTKGETKEIDGVEVVGLVERGTDGGTLWIPVEGEPLPVQGLDEDGNTIAFADWGKPVTIETPPADQVVDLSELSS
jgi:hypothetical protein